MVAPMTSPSPPLHHATLALPRWQQWWMMLLVWAFFQMSCTSWLAAADTFLHMPPAIQCNSTGGGDRGDCRVDNYQGLWGDRQPCLASRAFYPTSEAQLLHAVAFASQTSSKVKVVSKGSHSFPKLVCPGSPPHGILISTQFYNSLIHVNLSSLTVTAHSGVLLGTLLRTIASHNLTLPHTPYFIGVSLAGMISTGAHGSGMQRHGGAPHDYVIGMRIVVPASAEEGYAKVVELVDGDADLNAAKLSLGVLGAISTVTFQLEPMFKRSVKIEMRGDERLEDEVLEFAREHEFGRLKWYPGSGKALYRLDDRVEVGEEGDGEYLMVFTDKMDVKRIEGAKNALETLGRNQNIEGMCEEEVKLMHHQVASGDGLVNYGSTFIGYPVVGFNHKVEAAGGCEQETYPIINPTHIDFNPLTTNDLHIHEGATMDQDINAKLVTCSWNPRVNGFSFFDTAIAIPTSRFRDAIIEIKKLRDVNPKAMCSLAYVGGGIHMRFLSTSKAYLGVSSDSIVFEMLYYRSRTPFTSWLHQNLFEEIEQMLLDKFEGRPHWGKNRNLAFEDTHARIPALERFLEVRKKMDPLGIFSSEWSDAILGLQPSYQGIQTFKDHCAIEGLCVCQKDSHCHPDKGYFCRPGYVYKEARVCRYERLDSST